MEQFRVPVVKRAARIRSTDGQLLTGSIFLPALAPDHDGPMRVEEWINHHEAFFPFLPEGESRSRILNKHNVLDLTLLDHPDTEIDSIGLLQEVIVECGALHLDGTAWIDMPEHASRLLDWVNQPSAFILIRDSKGIHILQKRAITFIAEKAWR